MTKPIQMSERRPSVLRKRYDNFIGGKWVAPVKGRCFTDTSPLD
jgi:aldehyde dehydrogenase